MEVYLCAASSSEIFDIIQTVVRVSTGISSFLWSMNRLDVGPRTTPSRVVATIQVVALESQHPSFNQPKSPEQVVPWDRHSWSNARTWTPTTAMSHRTVRVL